MAKRESDFWKQIQRWTKTSTTKLLFTRIESVATPGIPDVLICDSDGHFHFIELKVITGFKVGLRPHQIAWLTRHSHTSAWVLIRKQRTNHPAELYLYHAKDAIELAGEGVRLPPSTYQLHPFDFDSVFKTIINWS